MIEILVVRDPDSSDDITVWLDGQEVAWDNPDFKIVCVDAGAGWALDDWEQAEIDALATMQTDEARHAVEVAFFDPPGKEYIEYWEDIDQRYPLACTVCGRVGTADDLIELGGPCQYADDESDPCDGIITHNRKGS